MNPIRRFMCWAGWHSGYVDGGYRCAYCSFFDPFTAEDYAVIDQDIERGVAQRKRSREIQLVDDVKTVYPEQWQQDAILQAWRTGEPVVGKPPE